MFVFKAAAPDVPMGEIYRAVVPILTVALLAVVVMTFFPAIVTLLPSRY
jgi:TRAP-type mannitol/chloroaromatic compound transport system permease large subunit